MKNLATQITERGDKVYFIARLKDVLFDLLRDCPFPVRYLTKKKKNGLWGQVSFILYRFRKMFLIARETKPDLIIGTDIVTTWVAKFNGIPSVILNEDDLNQVPLMKYGLRFCTASISPEGCDHGPFEEKHLSYKGIQESAYLHPHYFKEDVNVVDRFHDSSRPYFILRFAELSAHHDVGRAGLSDEQAMILVDKLSPHGDVYITSERPLAPELDERRIQIDPKDIHHVLAFAHMYIGDSQTMAAEAAILGTPSLRYNDFVGKLSYLEMLEQQFDLTKGIPVGSFELLIETLDDWLAREDLKKDWSEKADEFFKETEDVNKRWCGYMDEILLEH